MIAPDPFAGPGPKGAGQEREHTSPGCTRLRIQTPVPEQEPGMVLQNRHGCAAEMPESDAGVGSAGTV